MLVNLALNILLAYKGWSIHHRVLRRRFAGTEILSRNLCILKYFNRTHSAPSSYYILRTEHKESLIKIQYKEFSSKLSFEQQYSLIDRACFYNSTHKNRTKLRRMIDDHFAASLNGLANRAIRYNIALNLLDDRYHQTLPF